MKTLIFEPDPGRARGHVALFGDDPAHVDVARSLAQARLMLVNNRYDRLALTRGGRGEGASGSCAGHQPRLRHGRPRLDAGAARLGPGVGCKAQPAGLSIGPTSGQSEATSNTAIVMLNTRSRPGARSQRLSCVPPQAQTVTEGRFTAAKTSATSTAPLHAPSPGAKFVCA
jgi:hypothetical protein